MNGRCPNMMRDLICYKIFPVQESPNALVSPGFRGEIPGVELSAGCVPTARDPVANK